MVSPASGDGRGPIAAVAPSGVCFHSIGIPSEWGSEALGAKVAANGKCFHSIGIPSEWGSEVAANLVDFDGQFPFNWYPQRVGILGRRGVLPGETLKRFHSIGIPSEWGSSQSWWEVPGVPVFPFNWYPQRVGIGVSRFKQVGVS